jgi:YgiT-type zinc finger domain-containing protein
MMREPLNLTDQGLRRRRVGRRYPVRCVACGQREVRPELIRHSLTKNHDGRDYPLVIDALPVDRCGACGESYFNDASDDAISSVLRATLSLLTPEQIRANIETLGMQQKEVAECIGVAPETLSRWVTGAMIQSRAMDNLLRAYFGCREVRRCLTGTEMDPKFGATIDPGERDVVRGTRAERYTGTDFPKAADR